MQVHRQGRVYSSRVLQQEGVRVNIIWRVVRGGSSSGSGARFSAIRFLLAFARLCNSSSDFVLSSALSCRKSANCWRSITPLRVGLSSKLIVFFFFFFVSSVSAGGAAVKLPSTLSLAPVLFFFLGSIVLCVGGTVALRMSIGMSLVADFLAVLFFGGATAMGFGSPCGCSLWSSFLFLFSFTTAEAGVCGVCDRPRPPGGKPGAASQAGAGFALSLITFNPSNINAATSFCRASVNKHGICL
jgi:hypothetical protein